MKQTDKLLQGKRVLLAENDEVNQMLMRHMIEDQGANVDIESKGDSILRKLQSERYDLLMLDTRLESFNTLENIRKLREDSKMDVPIIGISSVSLKGRGIHAGLNEVLIRPIEYRNLRSVLSKMFPV